MTDRFKTNLTQRARELRRNATPQENHLWYDFLSAYPVKFRRQHIIQNYIVDFYCPTVKLVIEIDGSQHESDDGKAYDAYRTTVIEAFGCKVLRFRNDEINTNFDGVCEAIDLAVRAQNA